MSEKDEKFMKLALKEAMKGRGRTSPNPLVGAVIVRDQRVIASGYHRRAGSLHAEVEALSKIDQRPKINDTLYVTLEPCNHHGRTPPCTEAILTSGISNVVIGMSDPNPNVSGGGAEYLRKKGIHITTGILESECRALNEIFIKNVTSGKPFVLAKSAMTLDGWTATATGNSQWITNEHSRHYVHRLRDRVDAVLVGVGTIYADDPLLTTRLKNRRGRDPIRIVVDTHLRIPRNAKIVQSTSPAKTLIITGKRIPKDVRKKIEINDRISIIPCVIRKGRVDVTALMDILGKMEITSILVEGGSLVMGSLIREKLIDKFYIFKAPKILGGGNGLPMAEGCGPKKMESAIRLKNIKVKRFGDDILIIGYPVYHK